MYITLIRHTSVDVAQGICYGQTDVHLKATFCDEAAVVNEQLKGASFDAVYTSPLSRCVRLAEFCGYPDALRDHRLMEINMGDWEMQRFDEIDDTNLSAWYDDYLHCRTTNGESYEDMFARVSEFLDELKSTRNHNDSIAVFAHGGVLVCASVFAGITTPDKALSNLTPYGGLISIEI